MAFKENEPGTWKPESDGDSITGVLINIENDVGANNSKLYTLEVESKPTNIWGSAVLDQRMVGIKVGTLIRITFKGLGEPTFGKQAPKIFKVEYDDGIKETTPTPEKV